MPETKDTKPILFRLSEDLDAQLRELARQQDRSLAAQLRHLIREEARRRDLTPAA